MSEYFCPKCKCKEIVEYDNTFDCTSCKDQGGLPLEFSKRMFELWLREGLDLCSLLSINELSRLTKTLRRSDRNGND